MREDFYFVGIHGWADTNGAMLELARLFAIPPERCIVPDLGFVRTWIAIEPIVKDVEKLIETVFKKHPEARLRPVGHSMGGLVLIEVLALHPEWWPQVDGMVLLASPVGGASTARIVDPFGFGFGIARDLGHDRRAMAETIAESVPTLMIVGDRDGGSDGVVMVGATRFAHAQWICLPNITHIEIRTHAQVVEAIGTFWDSLSDPDAKPLATSILEQNETAKKIVQRLWTLPGITDGHARDLPNAQLYTMLPDGLALYTWKNLVGVDHVFLVDADKQCLFAGYVGWIDSLGLQLTLEEIKAEHAVN